MYGAKCMLVGLLAGLAIGASSTLVQRHMKAMCNCSKDLMENANSKMQDIRCKINNIDSSSISNVINDKLDQLKKMLDELTSSLTNDETKQKVSEVKEQVETLFQELKQNFSI
ncbi:MAG: hypothetical protein IJV94_01635 [Bacilli bacterium]|nr:hypothetical protein [Bacilli bacterium]